MTDELGVKAELFWVRREVVRWIEVTESNKKTTVPIPLRLLKQLLALAERPHD